MFKTPIVYLTIFAQENRLQGAAEGVGFEPTEPDLVAHCVTIAFNLSATLHKALPANGR